MQILENAPQGSAAWHTARSTRFCASEAAAAMGVSKYTTRSELLRQKATGISAEVSPATQRLFNAGHAAEAEALTIAEDIAGVEFYPAVGIAEIDGLPLLASFDGIDMLEEVIWENKLRNAALVGQVADRELEPHYWAQLEHQLLVSGANRALFTTSDGTPEGTDSLWYESVPDRRAQVIAAWKQFDVDLALYIPPAATVEAVGRAPETLPALRIEVTGMVTGSNLDAFKAHALAVFGGINRELSTDAQFADAEKTVKWCADVEDRLAAAKQHALSQTASIDELFRTIDDISAEARRVRLELDKLVKARKEAVRGELVAEGIAALRDHVAALNTRLGKPYMPVIPADFAGAIKGKRTVDSLRDAVNTELARAKIEASAVADRIQINLGTLRELAAAHSFLFADTAQIVLKAPDDLTMLVKSRIADHQAAEAAKEEATRTRIRAEEQAKAEQAARELVAREAAEAKRLADLAAREAKEAQERADAEASMKAAVSEPKAPPAQYFIAPIAIETVAPAANVVAMVRPATPTAATPDLAATIRLGQINDALGPCLQVSGANLTALGFTAVGRDKAAVLYRASDFPLMLAAMVDHLQAVQSKQAA